MNAREEKTFSFRAISRGSVLLLVVCLFVVLWGAFVRFSRSGDGCGTSWPLCEGAVIPTSPHIATWIEYAHRISSGLFGIGVLALFLFVFFRKRSEASPILSRLFLFAAGALFFTVTEGLIGAGLVHYELVGDNTSFQRALWLMGHLGNTLLLFAALTGLLLQSTFPHHKIRFFPTKSGGVVLGAFFGIALLGSLASLSNTLYPSQSLAGGLAQDLSSDSPLLVRLRILHPLIASALSLVFLFGMRSFFAFSAVSARWLSVIVIGNIGVGAMTLLLLSPLWGKVTHLFLADLIWLQLVAASLFPSHHHEEQQPT
ncbi:COX15/CtaA family protein [bacterium]|nr:COX15/CtaA family protein [bacterium]